MVQTVVQGDVIGMLDSTGNGVVSYQYNSWGVPLTTTDTTTEKAGGWNPFRYRGYCWDGETGLYYVGSRYYDPETCRFISPDTVEVLTATPMGLSDKNLYTYCDDNPTVREDHGGQFWETAFDVISLGASIVEVSMNPQDPLAWAGLVGDTIDLIPFVTGVGETTRAIKTTIKAVDKATDVVDTAKSIYKTADATNDIRIATGSYEILYKNGYSYIGKGGFKRAIASAIRNLEDGDGVLSILWKSAPNSREAFIDEYLMQKRFGGVLSYKIENLLTYNKIWSPGRRYYRV